jgi:hypothetical protein
MPGSIVDEPFTARYVAPNRGLPVNRLRMKAADALNALCPDVYSAKGGVAI